MTFGHQQRSASGWEDIGRAAEDFARRVAGDARRFASRLEEHVGEFAHDVRREWHCGRRAHRADHRFRDEPREAPSPDDVRRVLQDVRRVVAAVLEGVDEFITRTFQEAREPGADDATWARIVTNHDVACAGCAKPIAQGADAWVRTVAGQREFRCTDCGAPA